MGFSSRSSGKRHNEDNHRGSNYYKREGFFSRIFKMFGSFSSSGKRYDKRHSHDSHQNYHSNERHYSDHGYRRRRYKSSWS